MAAPLRVLVTVPHAFCDVGDQRVCDASAWRWGEELAIAFKRTQRTVVAFVPNDGASRITDCDANRSGGGSGANNPSRCQPFWDRVDAILNGNEPPHIHIDAHSFPADTSSDGMRGNHMALLVRPAYDVVAASVADAARAAGMRVSVLRASRVNRLIVQSEEETAVPVVLLAEHNDGNGADDTQTLARIVAETTVAKWDAR